MKLLAQQERLSYVDNYSQTACLDGHSVTTKTILTRLLLAFMLVWLPLQGYAAEAMSMCQRHHDRADMHENIPHEGCHGDHVSSAETPTSSIPSNLDCDDCASCHLIAQPALIVESLVPALDIIRLQQPIFSVTFTLFFPEQPQRPPLAFFS